MQEKKIKKKKLDLLLQDYKFYYKKLLYDN